MSLTQSNVQIPITEINPYLELLNQLYVPIPATQDHKNNYKVMQQKVYDVILDWTLHAPFDQMITDWRTPSKHVLCRAYRESELTPSPEEEQTTAISTLIEIIPLQCVSASRSNYTQVQVDLEYADLVQFNL